ncbi:MAG: RNA polymerase sigma factor [Nannocystales bacterium]
MALDVTSLYRKYGPMVLRRCKTILKDEEEALDAMQDVFVQIVRRADQLHDRGTSSLLYTTATRVCLNRLRSHRRRPQDPATDRLMQIADAAEAVDQSHARSVLGRLFRDEPESTATIAALHLHDGLTLEQTADAVGMSVSGVRKRLRKLKSSLGALEATAP